MSKVISEDSARCALKKLEQLGARSWQHRELRAFWEPLLYEPWVLDIDTTIIPSYGRQEGAQVGYNPHKPGRPSLPRSYDTGLVAVFRDRAALDEYTVHPDHVKVASFGREISAHVASVDFES